MYKIIGGDGKEYGPVDAAQLRQWQAEGRVNAQTRVQAEGQTEWRALADVPELNSPAAPPAAGPVAPVAPLPKSAVPNYLVPAILTTLFCCLPFGIVAIVYSGKVNTYLQAGDLAQAQHTSQKARLWCWVSLLGALVPGLLYALFFLAMGFVGGW